LDNYIDEPSKSRCGKIFSPENLVAKNIYQQLVKPPDQLVKEKKKEEVVSPAIDL